MSKHSVVLEYKRCRGCTSCIKCCPTEAIRVRGRRATILPDRCIDCGSCIRICPHKAIKSVGDSLDILNNYQYCVALPEPALYGQFHHLDSVDIVLSSLLKIGFHKVYEVAKAAEHFLDEQYGQVKQIVDEFDFNRIVYLGNIALKGVAQESALKMLELTAGQVATMYDSPLGFRHGPKSIIDPRTLTVVYLSDDEYRRRYEIDLIKEMGPQRKGNKIVAVMNQPVEGLEDLVDYIVRIPVGSCKENVLLGFDYILFAQTLAVMKSLSLGITPDNPCPTGEVNRVVKGVTLYPYTLK